MPASAPAVRSVLFLLTALVLVAVSIFCVPSARGDVTVPAELARVLSASGLDALGSKTRIAFTFNLEAGEVVLARRWDWDLTSDTVLQDGENVGKSPKFINDVYWLLFPAMVSWDIEKVKIESHPDVPEPISGLPSTQLIVTYGDGTGATPNDAYDLYVGKDGRVEEWTYRRADSAEPTRTTTWEGYQRIGGLDLSLDRKGEGFHIWFTDVIVE